MRKINKNTLFFLRPNQFFLYPTKKKKNKTNKARPIEAAVAPPPETGEAELRE